MRQFFALCLMLCSYVSLAQQQWYTSLEFAKTKAILENKMILMIWEDATQIPYPVSVDSDNGGSVFVENLFESKALYDLLYANFVPVIVSEDIYSDWYFSIKDKRSFDYMAQFDDQNFKVLDAVGNILNTNEPLNIFFGDYFKLTMFIERYALNTALLKQELLNYNAKPDFYSAYFLADKYLDFTVFNQKKLRGELLNLFDIYLSEARSFISETEDAKLWQRCELLELKKDLVLNRPGKVLRQLKKMQDQTIDTENDAFVAMLYYISYRLKGDVDEASPYESGLNGLQKKVASSIININTK
ncbi:hypothetical protein Q2T40_14015 [Winogradskyella maritima]|uniref:Uncharacterized protein n=1 Tax=Winogradskyella maritima TaxID=1517766 RepID=A0ABV8AHF5_9FLAO|nr:hypothetical protein [Winogradskyella maritima]